MSKSNKTLIKIIKSDNLNEFKSQYLSGLSIIDLNEAINVKSGENALHLSAIFNSIKVIKYLLIENKDKIDVNFKNKEEKSALHLSSQYGNEECVQLLLNNKNISIDILQRSDWSPLMLALTKHNLQIIKLLIENKANIRLRNKDGWNPFHIAVRSGGPLDSIEYLLRCDPMIWSTKSNTNRTPLHSASLSGNASVVQFLLNNCGYNCDERDCCGITPFMESIRCDCVQISRMFIEKQNVNPLLTDVLGRNALHISCEANALNSIKYLINDLNFDINCVTSVGQLSALHFAAKEGHKQTIELLLELGSDFSLKDSKLRTAYDLAISIRHYDCAHLLK